MTIPSGRDCETNRDQERAGDRREQTNYVEDEGRLHAARVREATEWELQDIRDMVRGDD